MHLLRIIGLVEADYNCALKIMYAYRLMSNAEAAGVSSDQWGGRANRDAPTCATRKALVFESARIMKTPVGFGSADKASCFDRMTSELATGVSAKHKILHTTCRCDSAVMRGMTRQVKTSHGVSRRTYGCAHGDAKLGGLIQGKGSVVAQWILSTDLMLQLFKK